MSDTVIKGQTYFIIKSVLNFNLFEFHSFSVVSWHYAQLFFCLPKLHIFCILCGYCGAGVEYIKNQLIINRQKDSLFSQYYEPSHECKSQWSGCFYALIIPEYTLNQFRLPEDVSRNCALNHEV